MAITLEPTPSKKTTSTERTQKADAAGAKIKLASEVDPYLKMCLYARNKLGKTRFACSSNLDTLVIDCNEKGFDSVRKQPNVHIYELTRWEDLDPIYWYLRAGKHPHKVIVIDTVTMLASIGMKWVLKDDQDRDMNKDPLLPSRPSYLKLNEMMKDAIIKFRNLPYHIIFNAQEKTTDQEDDDGNVLTEVHPELSPGSRSTLLSCTNQISRIYVKEVEKEVKGVAKKSMQRRIMNGVFPKYVSGGRFADELKPVEVIPPTGGLQSFLDRIYGESNNADAQ